MPKVDLPEDLIESDLECVMLDVESLDVLGAYGDGVNEDDLYFSKGPEAFYMRGDVGSVDAHVTLLFGIHPSKTYVEDVYSVLDGIDWQPEDVLIESVSHFPSSMEGEDYNCVVAKVVPTANLLSAHRALTTLTYSNRHSEYRPHVTLAYIKGSADLDEWVSRLNAAFSGKVLTPFGLNLGLYEAEID